MPAHLLTAVKLADQLNDALEQLIELYGPAEARRVLSNAGLAMPRSQDVCQSWGGDHFSQSHRLSRRLLRDLDEYREVVWDCINLLIPKEQTTAGDAEEGGAE